MNRRKLIGAAALLPLIPTAVYSNEQAEQASHTCKCSCVRMEDREGVIILSGRGEQLSELIELAAGTYRLEVETEPVDEKDDFIQVLFYRSGNVNPMGNSDYVLNGDVSLDYPQISTAAPIEVGGEYGVLVRLHSGPWKLGISPLR